ncbi:hypothetical protein T05_797 [Trichinella murrelli]|uniref:Uncharacterized protein n=1 Tax=Trichinella murrelli TaxID=144512 RepID=A0A0V0T453_9BILA|nr:hypothetical protein T05_797 [Trichinella murrelli]
MKCEATHHHASIKVAVAGERAQFSFDVVFSAVVALRHHSNLIQYISQKRIHLKILVGYRRRRCGGRHDVISNEECER